MERKNRRIPSWAIEITIVAAVALLMWIFVGFAQSITGNNAGGCISVTFDKPFVKTADRIIVYDGGQVVADISEKEEVRQIADLFTVANRTDQCDYKSGWRMEIYNGNRLVREISGNCCGGLYHIYDRNLLHWIFPSECGTGQVELSQEEEQLLQRIISTYTHK